MFWKTVHIGNVIFGLVLDVKVHCTVNINGCGQCYRTCMPVLQSTGPSPAVGGVVCRYSCCLIPSPLIPVQGKVWWHCNSFLVVQACDLTAMWLCAGCTLLCNGVQNHRAAFRLATANQDSWPCIYNIASQQDAISLENRRAAIWLACAKTKCWASSDAELTRTKKSLTRPFPSQRAGSGDKTTIANAHVLWSAQLQARWLWAAICVTVKLLSMAIACMKINMIMFSTRSHYKWSQRL